VCDLVEGVTRCVRKVAVHLGYGTYIWLSVPKLRLQCAVVSLYSVVKQRLKCNTGKVCECLFGFLLTVVHSIEDRVFLLNTSFQKAIDTAIYCRRNLLTNSHKHPVPDRNAVRRLIEKCRVTGCVRRRTEWETVWTER
jgi:hypothetical protein